MKRVQITRLLIPFAVGIAVAGGAIAISAYAAGVRLAPAAATRSTPSPSPAASNAATKAQGYCQDYVSHLATDLKTTPAKVDAAAAQAFQQTLADAVKNGDLTQEQADAIGQKVTGQQVCSSSLNGLGKKAPGSGRAGELGQYMQAYVAAAASALGMQPADVTAALKGGTSLSELAQQKGVSESDFRSKLIANLQPQLDQAVAGGKLTKDQENAIVQQLQTGPLPYWSRAPKPKASPSPNA